MQKINNFKHWKQLLEGTRIEFTNPKPRQIRLDVNAPNACCLYVLNGDGEAFFLARVEGRDVLDFHCDGPFALTVEGGEVNLYSIDGDDPSQIIEDPVIFTKIMERRRRNPELEQMMHKMQRNLERKLEAQADEVRRLLSYRAQAEEAQPAPKPVPAKSGTKSKPADNPGASDPSATATVSGGTGDE